MKKSSYLVAALLLACSAPTMTSCFVGSFSCTNKLWNLNNLTGSEIVNAVIGFILGPFETSIGVTLDTIIFNTYEFWTGSNPLAATRVMQGNDGQLYAVSPDGNGGYNVVNQETGEQMQYAFDKQTRTWSIVANGTEVKLFAMTDENNVTAYVNGQELTVSLDEQGLAMLQQAQDGSLVALK